MEVLSQRLAAGDIVKVELEVAVLREMQQNHGGWNDTMASVSLHILCTCTHEGIFASCYVNASI